VLLPLGERESSIPLDPLCEQRATDLEGATPTGVAMLRNALFLMHLGESGVAMIDLPADEPADDIHNGSAVAIERST
jgi:hypothetical protein